ncbi:MAG TPA: IPT/TIG domain-containing protein [Bryobacteraceae bacterium]|nr:IPT/TIG domain-containing protein [Bryobacteraceae bacterium]
MAKRQTPDSEAQILSVSPSAAIPGGELQIRGRNLIQNARAAVRFGDAPASVVVGSSTMIIARVPDDASDGELTVGESAPWSCDIGLQIADGLHPVANPAVDAAGNIYATFSGSRGQKTPVSVYRIDTNYSMRPFVTDVMNASGLAFDSEGTLYISSRHDGVVYQASPSGNVQVYVEGMGIATGLAFDGEDNLYVGDRSGTVFKISRQRQIYVFATVEPSIAAYHLAFGTDQNLYVTGPTTSSFDAVHRISPDGEVSTWYRGLGRPQGIAFDAEGRLYVAASLAGRRGVVRISGNTTADLFLSGPNIVGLAFAPGRQMVVATSNALFRIDAGVTGRPLP